MYTAYCKILGVEPGASQEEIKRAFRKKAKQSHPDINPLPSANQEFIKVKKAFDYLTGGSGADAVWYSRRSNYNYSFVRKKYYEKPESYDWESYRKWQNEFRQNYQNSRNDIDFRRTLIGKIIFYFFHILFLFVGLYILIAPTWSVVTDGVDPERNIAVTIFAVVCASLFGLTMTIGIVLSGFSINIFGKA